MIISNSNIDNTSKSIKLLQDFYILCTNLSIIHNNPKQNASFLNLISKLGGWPVVDGNNWNESDFDIVEMIVQSKQIGFPHNFFLDISVYQNIIQVIINFILSNQSDIAV